MHLKTKALLLVLILTLALSAITGTALAETTGTRTDMTVAEAIEVSDMYDRTVTLEKPASRVVAVMPADVEILYALGAGDVLVGRGEFADYPAEAKEVTAVASGNELNIEQILALEPDLVLLTKMYQRVEDLELMEKAGIVVAISDAQDIAGVYQAIAMIGALVGKDEEASELTADMKSRFDAVAERAAEEKGGTVYFEVSPLEYGLWTAGKETFLDEIGMLVGHENIFSHVDGWAEVCEEDVLDRDPDVIVTITMYFGEGPLPEEEIAGRNGWGNLNAVKNGRIYLADADAISRPGPRLTDAAEDMLAFLYPDEP